MSLRNTIVAGVLIALAFGAVAGAAAYLLLAPSAPLPNPASNGWDRDAQGQGVPVPDALRERLEEHDRNRGDVDELSPDFRPALDKLLERLRDEGWAARVALGPRSVEVQREMVLEGKSLILRGAHLCGLAADLSLYPVGMPPVRHRFWDAKDRIAVELGLDVVDYPPDEQGFVDRPHVQLRRCTDAEWDELGLSIVGTWSGEDATLVVQRSDERLTAAWTVAEERQVVTAIEPDGPGVHKAKVDGETMKIESSFLRGEVPDYQALTISQGDETWSLERD